MGRVNWYSGQVCPSGRRRRVGRVGRRLVGAWWCVRSFSMSDFDAVFTSGFVFSSSTQWYGRNTILTTFIFEQKSNTTLNHMLWYQLLRIPTPLCADWWCTDSCPLLAKHTKTQYLKWFRKTPTSTREVHIIRDRERIQYKYMEEKDHFTQTQLSALLLPLQLLPLAAPLFLLFSIALLSTCSNFAALSRCLFIGKNGATSSSSSSTMVGVVHLLHINGNKPNIG